MTVHRARIEFGQEELAILIAIVRRSPLRDDRPVRDLLAKLERADRMTDR